MPRACACREERGRGACRPASRAALLLSPHAPPSSRPATHPPSPQYYVTARHAAACPISGDSCPTCPIPSCPIPGIGCTSSNNVGFTFLGLLVVAPALAVIVLVCNARGLLDPIKNRMPAWLCGSGGGGGGSYSSSYKSVSATGSSAPIASAYGSA